MRRRVASALGFLLLLTAALAGCGDDASGGDDAPSEDGGARDGGEPDSEASGGSGGGGAGRGGRPAAGSGGRPPAAGSGGSPPAAGRGGTAGSGESVPCGAVTCEPSPDAFATACCADETTSTCGLSVLGGRCIERPEPEPACPPLDFAGILVLPSCCTARGMCGVDVTSVGGPGCLDLATAAERARQSGATVVFPAPRACGEEDAGVEDAGGVD